MLLFFQHWRKDIDNVMYGTSIKKTEQLTGSPSSPGIPIIPGSPGKPCKIYF